MKRDTCPHCGSDRVTFPNLGDVCRCGQCGVEWALKFITWFVERKAA